MRFLLTSLCLYFWCLSFAQADEKITLEQINHFLDSHSTAIMQKDDAKLSTLFSTDYQQYDTKTPTQHLNQNDIVKIYKNNFMVAKLIISKINLLDAKISEDAQHATLNTHIFSRYLIEFQGKQNILNQQEDWLSEVGLVHGQLVYLSTQKTLNVSP
ncbi:MAG: hypothetical protein IPI79_05700 [Moraxellaceae bacterium]|jgi:hypothetical protein|nr:hypothetical protein [Moraxellaceae bacterium]HQV80834.1 hypothetical protein [Agitococcus sp.]MBK7299931.1 hypothetical protein [Moraxellaceae bacterium]MBK9185939.1 hypothetical protein [Moraxellaceae bacterium]MBL0229570.1 hypothetical protein [Moraxellaceae bacterium]